VTAADDDPRRAAIAVIGAALRSDHRGLVLARAVAAGDPALSEEILAANRHKLLR
jgi:hypothetical protein